MANRVSHETSLPPHKSDRRYSRPSHGGLPKTYGAVEDQIGDLATNQTGLQANRLLRSRKPAGFVDRSPT